MYNKYKSFLAAHVFAALCALASAANASVVTFETIGGFNGDPFASVTQDGVTINSVNGSWQKAYYVGSPIPAIFTFSSTASIEVLTGGLFNFVSFDLGTGGQSNPAYEYHGFLNDVEVLSGSGSPGGVDFTTILSSDASIALDRLLIVTTLTSSSANLDNIVVNAAVSAAVAVPEPATIALLALGLLAMRMRRRATA